MLCLNNYSTVEKTIALLDEYGSKRSVGWHPEISGRVAKRGCAA